MNEKDGWNYTGNPAAGEDARKLVTLHDNNGMAWVGIRAWNTQGKYWMNNNEPIAETVHAWRALPDIARGQWSRGQLIMPEGASDE